MLFANRMNDLKPSDIREIGKLIAQNPGTISFAGGLPDPALFPSESIADVTNKILRDSSGVALQYGATLGRPSLREKIAGMMAKEGVNATLDNIIITTGSQQGLTLSTMVFLNPGEVIVTENPSYLGALAAFDPYETSYVGVNGDADGMYMDELEAVLQKTPNVKMIYVIPNFQNPTGRTWSLE